MKSIPISIHQKVNFNINHGKVFASAHVGVWAFAAAVDSD
jgi:hypothetical protein